MSKRGQSEGTIYRRKTDGRWVAAISIGHGVGGRGRKYFYAKTRAEANKQLKDAQRAQDEGRPQHRGVRPPNTSCENGWNLSSRACADGHTFGMSSSSGSTPFRP